MRAFTPNDWYWRLANDNRAYSSVRNAYVGLNDPAYADFLASGGAPSTVEDEAELLAVLRRFGVSVARIGAGSAEPDPLALRRSALLRAVAAQMEAKVAAGYPYQNKVVQIDAEGRFNLTASAAMAQAGTLPNPFAWRMLDNSEVPINGPMLIQLASDIGAYYYALRKRAWALKTEIMSANDAGALDAIDLSVGWPVPAA